MDCKFIMYGGMYQPVANLADAKFGRLMKAVFEYQINGVEIELEDDLKIAFLFFKNQFILDKEKYSKIVERRSEAGKLGGVANASKRKQKVANLAKPSKAYHNDNDNDNDNKEKESESADADGVPPTPPLPEESDKQGTPPPEKTRSKLSLEIDDFIAGLKELCVRLDVAYDKEDDRNFARHLLISKDYGAMCDRKEQSKLEFAKNVMLASKKFGYRKGVCTGPKMIYQEYSEVYNLAKTQKEKQERQDKPTHRPLPPNFH